MDPARSRIERLAARLDLAARGRHALLEPVDHTALRFRSAASPGGAGLVDDTALRSLRLTQAAPPDRPARGRARRRAPRRGLPAAARSAATVPRPPRRRARPRARTPG